MTYIVYTKEDCGFCVMLKKLLESKDLEYTEVNIEEDDDARQFLINEGHRSVPQIYKSGMLIEGGFTGMKKYLAEQDLGTL